MIAPIRTMARSGHSLTVWTIISLTGWARRRGIEAQQPDRAWSD